MLRYRRRGQTRAGKNHRNKLQSDTLKKQKALKVLFMQM